MTMVVMAEQNYDDVFEVLPQQLLHVDPSEDFRRTGGFDEQYFYLEDADITPNLAREGQCVHLPVGNVVHGSWQLQRFSLSCC